MSGSASGGKQNQNQTTTTSGQTSGTSNTTNQGQYTRNQTVNPTDIWNLGSNQLFGNLGQSGLNGGQQGQVDYLTGRQAGGALPNEVGYTNSVLSQYVGNNYQAPTAAAPGSVAAPSGASQMGQYENPYENQVVQSTMADLGHAFDQSQNQLRAQYGGQGWSPTAGAPAGEQVAAAEGANNYLRTLGSTIGNLRSQGFNTAAGYGQQDASRISGASAQDAANTMANNQFNARQKSAADAQSIGVAQNYIQDLMKMNGIDSANSGQIFDMAGVGNSNLLNLLGSQVPAFGQSNSGTTSGTSNTATTGTASGTSNTRGSSSSKGGGIGGPLG